MRNKRFVLNRRAIRFWLPDCERDATVRATVVDSQLFAQSCRQIPAAGNHDNFACGFVFFHATVCLYDFIQSKDPADLHPQGASCDLLS